MSPELIKNYGEDNKIVVVVDILRATSCMVTAFEHGVKTIIPVSSLEECEVYKQKGYITAAERNGKIVEGFDMGNSPFSYMNPSFKGKAIVVTTTNGTSAIQRLDKAKEVIIGSFLNKSAIAKYLIKKKEDVLILCAGWKGKMNLEDTIFAGALVEELKDHFYFENDSAFAAQTLYHCSCNDLFHFITVNSSHYKRLKGLHLDEDIKFCLQQDIYNVIPVLKDGVLVNTKKETVKV